ncbi:hypothetical protein GCM10022403_005120 [Streptomyces coacervatus]|uniref:Uncharacterized protein n=1 Tax=Streptomyces coacervatus TaxID=647381 RepID=A0ABP7GUP5_9ACTN
MMINAQKRIMPADMANQPQPLTSWPYQNIIVTHLPRLVGNRGRAGSRGAPGLYRYRDAARRAGQGPNGPEPASRSAPPGKGARSATGGAP